MVHSVHPNLHKGCTLHPLLGNSAHHSQVHRQKADTYTMHAKINIHLRKTDTVEAVEADNGTTWVSLANEDDISTVCIFTNTLDEATVLAAALNTIRSSAANPFARGRRDSL